MSDETERSNGDEEVAEAVVQANTEAETAEVEAAAEDEAKAETAWRRAIGWSKATQSWARTLAVILVVLVPGTYATVTSEKSNTKAKDAKWTASSTWQVAQKQLTDLVSTVNILKNTVAALKESNRKLALYAVRQQGMDEGVNQGRVQMQLQQALAELAALKSKQTGRRRVIFVGGGGGGLGDAAGGTGHLERAVSNCQEGFVEIAGRCKRVPKAVAKAVKEDRKQIQISAAKLAEQKRKLRELEAKQAAADMQQAAQKMAKPMLKAPPRRLNDAVKALKGGDL